MSKKANIEELLRRRDRLTERIKELQEVELKGVANWMQQTTGCYSVGQLEKEGWILMKKQPENHADQKPQPEGGTMDGTGGVEKAAHNGQDLTGDKIEAM